VCQLYPNASVSMLVTRFFTLLHGMEDVAAPHHASPRRGKGPWASASRPGIPAATPTTSYHLMPIITPAYPFHELQLQMYPGAPSSVMKEGVPEPGTPTPWSARPRRTATGCPSRRLPVLRHVQPLPPDPGHGWQPGRPQGLEGLVKSRLRRLSQRGQSLRPASPCFTDFLVGLLGRPAQAHQGGKRVPSSATG